MIKPNIQIRFDRARRDIRNMKESRRKARRAAERGRGSGHYDDPGGARGPGGPGRGPGGGRGAGAAPTPVH